MCFSCDGASVTLRPACLMIARSPAAPLLSPLAVHISVTGRGKPHRPATDAIYQRFVGIEGSAYFAARQNEARQPSTAMGVGKCVQAESEVVHSQIQPNGDFITLGWRGVTRGRWRSRAARERDADAVNSGDIVKELRRQYDRLTRSHKGASPNILSSTRRRWRSRPSIRWPNG